MFGKLETKLVKEIFATFDNCFFKMFSDPLSWTGRPLHPVYPLLSYFCTERYSANFLPGCFMVRHDVPIFILFAFFVPLFTITPFLGRLYFFLFDWLQIQNEFIGKFVLSFFIIGASTFLFLLCFLTYFIGQICYTKDYWYFWEETEEVNKN